MTTSHHVRGVPFALAASPGATWTINDATGTVAAIAAPCTDLFIAPGSTSTPNPEPVLNAATLLGIPPGGDFRLSARVTVDFAATFDAGVLLLWFDERHWGKLCFEFSPAGEPMIVSVVTRGASDDANAFVVDGRMVWLRVSRIDEAFAFHASLDGVSWRMIRFFRIDGVVAPLSLGLEAQSPTGDGCTVTFDEITFDRQRLEDLRDGS